MVKIAYLDQNLYLYFISKLPKEFFQFCQPGGWKTYEFAKPPETFNFIFTNCEGAYTYVSCLIVYEDCTDILDNTDCIDVDDEIQPSFFYRLPNCKMAARSDLDLLISCAVLPNCVKMFHASIP